MSNVSFLKPNKENLNLFLVFGTLFIVLGIFDFCLNNFYERNITGFLPGFISFFTPLFFGMIGITNGLANVLGSSTWAEIYGVKYIGSIKALTTALMVFATAFGTALFGILIDYDFRIEQIAAVSGVYILSSIILLYMVKNKLNPEYL